MRRRDETELDVLHAVRAALARRSGRHRLGVRHVLSVHNTLASSLTVATVPGPEGGGCASALQASAGSVVSIPSSMRGHDRSAVSALLLVRRQLQR
jgi:hypothetical protein